MTDIASLGIRVQTTGVKEGAKDLDRLATSGDKAAASVERVGTSARKSSDGFNSKPIREQQKALADLLGKIDPVTAALGRLDEQEKKLRGFRAKGLIDTDTFRDYAGKIDASRAALTRYNNASGQGAKSAKELSSALRQVPMQFTDIATSLASGQRPLQVLMQQGGQLKDLFGGIGPAVRALGSYVLGLVNPFTLAAAAVIGLVSAWKTASDEAERFNMAVIKTGNFARLSADDLEDLADQLDRTTEATERYAGDVLTQVINSGRFTHDQVKIVTEAIVNMSKAVQASGGDADEAVKDLIKSFTDLSRDPVEALLKLNETQHFLTEGTLKTVQSLKDQGKEAEAVETAVNAMASTVNERADQMQRHLGATSIAFSGLRNAAAEALDSVVEGFREADEAALEFLRSGKFWARSVRALIPVDFDEKPAASGNGNAGGFNGQFSIPGVNSFSAVPQAPFSAVGSGRIVDSAAERARRKEQEEEERRAASFKDQYLTREENKKKAIAELDRLRSHYTAEEYRILRAGIEERFKPPKGRQPRKENTRGIENASDRFDDMVGQLRSELDGPLQQAEQQHLKRMREIEQAARDGKRSHEDLTAALKLEAEAYAQSRTEIEQRIDAEVASLSGPLAAAQADHEAALRRIEELKKTGRVTGDEYNAMLAEEAKRFAEASAAAERAADPLGALLSDMRDELDLIGKTNAEAAVMVELRRQNIDAMSAEGQAAIELAKTYEEEAKAKQRSIALMDEFRGGASSALADIVTGAKSAKEAFADFFDDLARRITQMIAEQWIERAFGAFGTSQTGSSGGWLSMLFSAFAGSGGGGSMMSGFGGSYAKGAAFVGGVEAFANGGVPDGPRMFPMARGRWGVMNEGLDREAILPLHRGPDGKLGVRMAAEQPREERRIVRSGDTYIQVQGAPNKQTLKQLERANGRGARREMARTGS